MITPHNRLLAEVGNLLAEVGNRKQGTEADKTEHLQEV
jgi:hypothetical protein